MNEWNSLQQIVIGRRSIKPSLMNGKKIEQASIKQLLALADWAPTHGRTEPWRFIVYAGEKLKVFCHQHANLYQAYTDTDKFTTAKYNGILETGEKVSHLVIVYMKRQLTQKIPLIEEIAAVAAAVEHILLGAQALNIAALWSTGGMTHHESLKKLLELADEDIIMGLLYLGYTDETSTEGKRNIPLSEKTTWHT
ncbi:MAG: nitroreductase family protein [Bacteroidota bacterium]